MSVKKKINGDLVSIAGNAENVPTATSNTKGIVQPDNSTITIDVNGILTAHTNFTDVLDIAHGGTGNSTGYIDIGRKANTTIGTYSTAEGYDTEASGSSSHAEGIETIASKVNTHAEGSRTTASGNNSHAEGSQTTASGVNSHAEGSQTTASGDNSHAEGEQTTASDTYAHAEGYKTTASGTEAHAEGNETIASGYQSHAEGRDTIASGDSSHAEGRETHAKASASHAGGTGTIAAAQHQTTIGKYNVESTDGYFIIGSGIPSSRSNCFRATSSTTYGKTYNTNGADYAEMFEWLDGNPTDEDRIGLFVTLEEDKIRIANNTDDFILGVVSGTASVIGDEGDEWHNMFVTDVYGRYNIIETYIPAEVDSEGHIIVPAYYEKNLEVSPDHDPSKEYIHRKDRKEWDIIGILGKLILNDDGTANANDYVWSNQNGIATKSNIPTKYRVMKRLDETHIKVIAL